MFTAYNNLLTHSEVDQAYNENSFLSRNKDNVDFIETILGKKGQCEATLILLQERQWTVI